MIRYSLKCPQDHAFESWFQSGSACDALLAAGRVECPECGRTEVHKSLMAPSVLSTAPVTVPSAALSGAGSDARIETLRRDLEANAEYVGRDFASQARAMHEGLAPHRPVWGEARADEARRLVEEGVPVAPLPFVPSRKMN